MLPNLISLLGTGVALALLAAAGPYPPDVVDELASASISKLEDFLANNPAQGGCTIETAVKRREWSDISVEERLDYINAVKCLQAKPRKSSRCKVPGARSLYDDFVATHIIQTPSIHASANFLTWHRYFLWAYEKALQDECGYKGAAPYWNWDRYAEDPLNSPIFNGNESSMSGNGLKVDHPGVAIPAPPPFDVIPPAEGGGCVTTGPFKDFQINLGPVFPTLTDVPPNPRFDGLGYNPRCLRRDVNKNSAAVTKANYTYDLITKSENIYWFQTIMQGQFELGKWGVHTGGHFTIGGDPAGDFFTSPGDPAFWLHHSMIDRVWWIWQLQDLSTRLSAVSGVTIGPDFVPGVNGTLDDDIDLGWTAPKVKLRDLLDTMGGNGGKFCYMYV